MTTNLLSTLQILERDAEAKEKAPEVMKNNPSSNAKPNINSAGSSQSRSYSTTTRRYTELLEVSSSSETGPPPSLEYPNGGPGHKFGLPDMPLPRTEHFRRRYDPVVEQLTKSLMRDGKLSAAQKVWPPYCSHTNATGILGGLLLLNCAQNMSIILDTLRTAPPPKSSTARPLLGNFPPALILPLSPIKYLTAAIDSVAPLVKIRQQRGIMGGGVSLPIPVPLGVKQRRRTAMQWILSSADKRQESRLADRVSRELIAVVEGRSSVWDRRATVHKLGISARSNVRLATMRRRK